MNNVVNIRDYRKVKNLENTLNELEQVIKSLEVAKKSLLPHLNYSGVKRLVLEIDDSRKIYSGLYKKAKHEIRILNGENIDE